MVVAVVELLKGVIVGKRAQKVKNTKREGRAFRKIITLNAGASAEHPMGVLLPPASSSATFQLF